MSNDYLKNPVIQSFLKTELGIGETGENWNILETPDTTNDPDSAPSLEFFQAAQSTPSESESPIPLQDAFSLEDSFFLEDVFPRTLN